MDKETLRLTRCALIDADHLAECAKRLLSALDEVASAEELVDATYGGSERDKNRALEELDRAKELRNEYCFAVKEAAQEYEQRAQWARNAMQTHNAGIEPPRSVVEQESGS